MINLIMLGEILLASFLYTLVIQLIYKKFINQNKAKELNSRMKSLQREAKELSKTDSEKALKLQNQILSISMEKMSMTSKATMATMFLFMVTFEFFKNIFKGFVLFSWNTNIPIIGYEMGWFLTFFIASILFNPLLKKALKVEM